MSKTTLQIPDDIDRIATDIVRAPLDGPEEPDWQLYIAIAKALFAEREAQRERDAKIAEKHFDLRHADKARYASNAIAAAIRKGEA